MNKEKLIRDFEGVLDFYLDGLDQDPQGLAKEELDHSVKQLLWILFTNHTLDIVEEHADAMLYAKARDRSSR